MEYKSFYFIANEKRQKSKIEIEISNENKI